MSSKGKSEHKIDTLVAFGYHTACLLHIMCDVAFLLALNAGKGHVCGLAADGGAAKPHTAEGWTSGVGARFLVCSLSLIYII